MKALRALGLAMACAACGGGEASRAPAAETAATNAPTSGEETNEPAADSPLPPADPARSRSVVLDEPYRYVIRVELSRVRDTPLEPEVRRLLEAIPQWRSVMQATGFDPIAEIDALVAASPGRGSREYVLLAKHRADEARVRTFAERVAEERGAPLEWAMRDGVAAAYWPGEDSVVQSVALPRPKWLVLGPSAEVSRMVAISQNGGGQLVPEVAMPWDQGDVTDGGAGLQATGRGIMGGEERLPFYPLRFDVRIENDAAGNVTCRWAGYYEDAASAAAARDHWDGRRREYAGNPLLAVLGLRSAIEGATFGTTGDRIDFRLDLTLLQMSRLIRFATPILVGARRDMPTGTETGAETRE
jgi:hypothetical protein